MAAEVVIEATTKRVAGASLAFLVSRGVNEER
jgi:Fe-S cluster assembly scaffold protein SufB